MALVIADTDVLIDFLAGKEPGMSAVTRELERGGLVTTAITWFELFAGNLNAKQKRIFDQLFEAVPVLSLDLDAADKAAGIHRMLLQRGEEIGMADSLIAGMVFRHGGTLLTRNRKHFERVPGLELASL
ncbi:MAG: type II toxin-antitoxin system VapC family toxin [Bdellovibrionota bacterium]